MNLSQHCVSPAAISGNTSLSDALSAPIARAAARLEAATLQSQTVNHPDREGLEQYIGSLFRLSYGARIEHYLPLLCALQRDKHYSAALGLRRATAAALFCEHYLEQPVEQQVLASFGKPCPRRDIFELGNLAASEPGQSPLLYLLAVAALAQAGVRYLLFAANRAVRVSIKRSGFSPRVIGPADPRRLASDADEWGSYYQGDPVTMLADIALTLRQAEAQPAKLAQLKHYAASISQLATQIRAQPV